MLAKPVSWLLNFVKTFDHNLNYKLKFFSKHLVSDRNEALITLLGDLLPDDVLYIT